jgi:hypothetical protein
VFGFSLKNALDLAGIRCAACAGADTLSTAGFTGVRLIGSAKNDRQIEVAFRPAD